jgi:uncharacterized membrane protein
MAEFIPAGRTVPLENGWSWIEQGWGLFKRNPAIWIALVVLLAVIYIAAAFIPLLGSLAMIALTPVFMAGLATGCRDLEQGGELKIEHLFAGFKARFGVLLAVGLLYLAANVVVAFVAGFVAGPGVWRAVMSGDPSALAGAALTVLLAAAVALALMIPVLAAVWFTPVLVSLHGEGAMEAIRASFVGCLRNFVPFLVYGVVLLVLGVLASIPFGLGWLVLGPVVVTSFYASYRDIFFN